MTAVLRVAKRLAKRPKLGAKVPRPDRTFRASLRKVKKRWHIPGRIRDKVETLFEDLFGNSPRGTTWSALAERYPERFKEYVDQAQEAEAEEESDE